MRWKKIATALFLGLLCLVFLSGQSLYELAQKEKARRAKLQGKISKVVTNADLSSSDKTASVTTTTQPAAKRQPQQQTSSSSSSNPRVVLSKADQQRVQRGAARSPQFDQRDASRGSLKYATEVLSTTRLVDNPEWALRKPDGQFAEIKFSGMLELGLTAQNGRGADFTVFARASGAEAVKAGGQEEGGISTAVISGMVEGFWYGVSALDQDGQWIALGRGNGENSPETFDLGDISSTTKIRIVFQPPSNPGPAYTLISNTPKDMTFGIDAVSVLH